VYTRDASQHWVAEEIGDGKILLRNWGNQQCVRNFE